MALLGTLLKKGIRIRESLEQEYSSPFDLQKLELKKLMITAANTEFGKYYGFKNLLKSFRKTEKSFYHLFKREIPLHDYDRIFNRWWSQSLKGRKNICWPGKVKYFALSSGTSGAPSKHIPITNDMTKAIRKTSVRQLLTLSKYDLPGSLFESGILMIGGSTDLNNRGSFFEGDLTGIQASQIPFWFQSFYKPGKKIAKEKNWTDKLEEITKKAPTWNIGIVVGVPSWIQLLLEKIIEHYKVKNIHEIWPDFRIYVHGGVFFDPYKKGFEKLLGKPLHYINTYLASEGFIAFQAMPAKKSMRLVLNNGIFYEFIPFDEKNFGQDGELVSNPEVIMIDEVEEGVNYALVISSCAGAWRYLIGDTLKFVSKEESEIEITGRTKHYLSLCGEHLSIENMNRAVEEVSHELNFEVKEFAVAGLPNGSLFEHRWFIGTDSQVDPSLLKTMIDQKLKDLNDDYRTERSHALKEIQLEVLPTKIFYQWMKKHGKEGGQNKFPRVIKGSQLKDWLNFLVKEKVSI